MSNIIGQEIVQAEITKILQIFKNSEGVIRPHFILTGPSGSGKSFTISTLAEKLGLSCATINAAQLTREGTSGNSLSKALSPVLSFGGKAALVFIDEFDKLFISGNSNTACTHEATTAVQNEFLKVLENTTTSVFGDYGKYIEVNMTKILFVFAGAFNGEPDLTIDRLREMGIKTEFLGRVGLIYNTEKLTAEQLCEIVDNSELLEHYCELFHGQDKEKVSYILKGHIIKNHENNTIGARFINTLIHQYFIKGGLEPEQVKKIAFQNKMEI